MTAGFPKVFTGTVTWYLEDDTRRQKTSPRYDSIAKAKAWCERYMDKNDLDGLGEVRVNGVGHEAPAEGSEPAEGHGEGRTRPSRKSKLSRPMSQTLLDSYLQALESGQTHSIPVKPHDGMIAKGLLNRGLIARTESGYWRMTPDGRKTAEALFSDLVKE